MKFYVLLVSLLIFQTSVVESKPLATSRDFETINEVDRGQEQKKTRPIGREGAKKAAAAAAAARSVEQRDDGGRTSDDVIVATSESSDVRSEESPVNGQQYNTFPNFLVPLLQRLQFSPQTFFQDRLNQLKDSLANFGLAAPGNNATATSKQFPASNGLLNLIGLNDSGFYTDRLEPAGFLGGNGWFANKGGILGGPGAIYSTGSLLTDYPTAYKK